MLPYIPFLIGIAVTLLSIKLWLRRFYWISLGQLVLGLRYDRLAITTRVLCIPVLIVATGIVASQIASLIILPFHMLAGDTTEMVFAGYTGPGTALLYEYPAQDARLAVTHVFSAHGSNTSFHPLFQQITFKAAFKQPGTFYGTPFAGYSPFPVLGTLSLLILSSLLSLTALHPLAWNASNRVHISQPVLAATPRQAFDLLLARSGIGKPAYALGIFGSIITMVIFFTLSPEAGLREPILDVTRFVSSGKLISGTPQNYYRYTEHYKKQPSDSSYSTRDNGQRTVSFKIDDVFTLPVYVSLSYNAFERPEQDHLIRELINQNKKIDLIVTESLGIRLSDSLLSSY